MKFNKLLITLFIGLFSLSACAAQQAQVSESADTESAPTKIRKEIVKITTIMGGITSGLPPLPDFSSHSSSKNNNSSSSVQMQQTAPDSEQLCDMEDDQDMAVAGHQTNENNKATCKICGNEFSKGNIKRHFKRCEANFLSGKKYECSLCSKPQGTERNLVLHMRKVHPKQSNIQEEQVTCKICGNEFAKANIVLHLRSCEANFRAGKTYQCSICLTPQGTESNLFAHMKNVHPKTLNIPEEQMLPCPICQEKYPNPKRLTEHVSKEHPGKKPFKCKFIECDCSYTTPENCLKHERICQFNPSPDETFKCDNCGKLWIDDHNLKKHLESCSKQEQGTRKNHMGNLKCDRIECNGKNFNYWFELQSHINGHSKEQTFKCTKCPKAYTTHVNLRTHMRNEHGTLKEEFNVILEKLKERFQESVESVSESAYSSSNNNSSSSSSAHLQQTAPSSNEITYGFSGMQGLGTNFQFQTPSQIGQESELDLGAVQDKDLDEMLGDSHVSSYQSQFVPPSTATMVSDADVIFAQSQPLPGTDLVLPPLPDFSVLAQNSSNNAPTNPVPHIQQPQIQQPVHQAAQINRGLKRKNDEDFVDLVLSGESNNSVKSPEKRQKI